MKKKLIIILSCLFIIAAGVCYSCSYNREKEQGVLLTSLESGKNDGNPQDSITDSIAVKEDLQDAKKEEAVSKTGGENFSHDNAGAENNTEIIYIHLCGAVANPDVYQAEAGSRLVDLIEMAGGLNQDAAGDFINQAMVVEDGQRIYIPTRDELKELTLSEYIKGDQNNKSEAGNQKSKVNINTADENGLMSLPGIGQAKAKNIIEYRNKNGTFSDIKDLMKVPGIKEGLFNQIADLITVGN